MLLFCKLLKVDCFFVEGPVPAMDVAVARRGIAEWRLVECLDGLAAPFFEGDRDQHFNAGRRPLVVPGKCEHQALVLLNYAIDAAEPVLTTLLRFDQDAIGAPDAEIDCCFRTGEALRPHPSLEVSRVRPKCENEGRRCVEAADDQKLVVSRFSWAGHPYLL